MKLFCSDYFRNIPIKNDYLFETFFHVFDNTTEIEHPPCIHSSISPTPATNGNTKTQQHTETPKHIINMFINEEQKATLVEKTQQYFKQVVTLTPDNAYESRIKFHNDISRKEGLLLILTLASKETHKFSKNNWHLGTFGSVWRDIRIGNKIIRAYFVEASNGVFQTICNVYDTIDEENKINDWMPQLVDPINQKFVDPINQKKSEENNLNVWVRIMPVADSSKPRHQKKSNKSKKSKTKKSKK